MSLLSISVTPKCPAKLQNVFCVALFFGISGGGAFAALDVDVDDEGLWPGAALGTLDADDDDEEFWLALFLFKSLSHGGKLSSGLSV